MGRTRIQTNTPERSRLMTAIAVPLLLLATLEARAQTSFKLDSKQHEASPGEVLEVTLSISSSAPVELAAFSVEFDSSRLEVLGASLDPSLESAQGWTLEWYHQPGEDWVQGVALLGPEGEGFETPSGEARPVVLLSFRVAEDAPPGSTIELRLTPPGKARYQGHLFDGQEYIHNAFRNNSRPPVSLPEQARLAGSKHAEVQDAPVSISILGDVGLFNRLDFNGDGAVDVSDPVYLLGFLFLGGPAPPGAADANNDGSVDLGDVLSVLFELFLAD